MLNQQMKPSYIYILYIMNILELIVFLFDDSETQKHLWHLQLPQLLCALDVEIRVLKLSVQKVCSCQHQRLVTLTPMGDWTWTCLVGLFSVKGPPYWNNHARRNWWQYMFHILRYIYPSEVFSGHILDILGFTILISFDLLIYTPEN